MIDFATNNLYYMCNITSKFVPRCDCNSTSNNIRNLNVTNQTCSCNYVPSDTMFIKNKCGNLTLSPVWAGEVAAQCNRTITDCFAANVTVVNKTGNVT